MMQIEEDNYEAEQSFFQKVDRILTGKMTISVSTVHTPCYWTKNPLAEPFALQIGNQIMLNFERVFDTIQTLQGDYMDAIIMLKGLNYHELSHYLFTDYGKNYPLYLKEYLNCLEDQRIETMFGAIYPKVETYFEYTALKLIDVSDFLLIWGRKTFLPSEFVRKSESVFREQHKEKTDEAKKIIDKFIIEKDKRKRVLLAERLYLLFDKKPQFSRQTSISYSLDGTSHAGKRKTENGIDSAKKKMAGLKKRENEKSCTKSADWNDDKKTEEMAKAQEKMKEETAEDVKTIRATAIFGGDTSANYSGKKLDIDEKTLVIANNLKKVFSKLKNEKQSGYLPNKKSGRIDVRKAMVSSQNGNLKIFKKWQKDRTDEVKLAVKILIDSSGSMQQIIKPSFRGGWAISKSLETINSGVVSIACFNTSNIKIKGFNDRTANWMVTCGGGTDPNISLAITYDEMNKLVDYKNKMLFIITDGEWFGNNYEIILDKLKKKGVKIMVLLYNQYHSDETIFSTEIMKISSISIKDGSILIFRNVDEIPDLIRNSIQKQVGKMASFD